MKRLITLSFILISLLSFGQSKLTKKADSFYESGKYGWAEFEYKKALERKKGDFYTLVRIADCNVKLNRLETAAMYLTEAKKHLNGPAFEFYYVEAQMEHKNYQFDEAIVSYTKAKQESNASYIERRIAECKVGKGLHASPIDAKLINLRTINSEEHDVLPKITADFEIMYFTSARSGAIGGQEKSEDIYITRFIDNEWTAPEQVAEPLNSKENEACVGLSQDGQTMFLFRGSNGGDLFISHLKGNSWTVPEPFKYNTEYRESSMCISPNGKTLLFVRSKGDQNAEIYECSKEKDGSWGKPSLFSSKINSEYDEASPYLHPDGVTLYFSSKGHKTMGGHDIFKSELVDGEWTEPENLGYPINTTGDDICFVLDASFETGFYSSSMVGGVGGQDIYEIKMPKDEKHHQLSILKGVITDAVTKKPIEADIVIVDNDKNEVVAEFKSNEATGEYLVSLPGGIDYGIHIDHVGSLFHSEHVFVGDDAAYNHVVLNVELVPEKTGSKIVLNNIFFASGSSELDVKSHAEMDLLVKILTQNESIRIEVSGHTDNIGTNDSNQKLSEARANAVRDYVISKGISADRITAVGYGSEAPIQSNDTVEGRSANRRTEMKIL